MSKATLGIQDSDEASRLSGLSLVYHTLGRAAESDAALSELKAKFGDEAPVWIAETHA